MKIKCAIFDFDGTLFDSMFIWETAGEIYLHSIGKEPKPTTFEEIKTMSLYQAAVYFRKEYALPFSPEEIMDGINKTIENFYIYDVLPKPGAAEFLIQMQKAEIPMCIATATDRYQIEAALKRCKMDQYFDRIYTCSEVGHGKDEPDIFRQAMEYFGADRTSTIIFEDALHAVKTAKADGFIVAAVFDKSEKRQAELQNTSDFYLIDFEHTQSFWKFAAAE